jgi:hypothetical protein
MKPFLIKTFGKRKAGAVLHIGRDLAEKPRNLTIFERQ